MGGPKDPGITQIDAQIMLAGVLRYNFEETQALVQGLNPYYSVPADNEWCTWLMANNCYASQSFAQVMLPLAFLENLRSLRGRAIYGAMKPSKKGFVPDHGNPQLILPVLGQFPNDTIDSLEYYDASTEEMTSIWAVPDGGQLPNLWDGYIGNNAYNITTSEYIESVITNWNKFMAEISNVVESPGVLGSEDGIMAFSTIGFTNYYEVIEPLSIHVPRTMTIRDTPLRVAAKLKEMRAKPSRTKSGKFVKVAGVDDSTTNTLTLVSAVGSVPFNAIVWPYIKNWVKPSFRLGMENNNSQVQLTVTNFQALYGEPHRLNASLVSSGEILQGESQAKSNVNFATMMVHPPATEGCNTLTQALKEAAAQGRGSSIMDVIKTFAIPFAEVATALL